MPHTPTSGRLHRVRAAIVLGLFTVALVAAASIGWWYARESPPHQGPLVLVSVDGVDRAALAAYGGAGTQTPALDALARDAVVFDRAYTHALQLLPAHASLLSGRLPFEHGVRDDAGFTLSGNVRTLAEQLASRGFRTGAVVSSFLLRRESGLARGFASFDADRPSAPAGEVPVLERDAQATADAASRWIASASSRRYFLFVQLVGPSSDAAVGRILDALRARGDYDEATIVVVGDRGKVGPGLNLDESSLRVPLLVKQPSAAGAGLHVSAAVQHIDLTPTLLDLVRAPVPGDLRGRSLRGVLDGNDVNVPSQPIYAESLAASFRFGGQPEFALTEGSVRYRRGVGESVVGIDSVPVAEGSAADATRLRAQLERMVGPSPLPKPARIEAADADHYALVGLLESVGPPAAAPVLTEDQQTALVAAHREAASLVGQRKYSAGIRALRTITQEFPTLAAVHYQLGTVLARSGRVDEAIDAFRTSRDLQPESAEGAWSLAEALLRAGDLESASQQADVAVALAERDENPETRAVAHEIAARVALARKEPDVALAHGEAADMADPARPVLALVRGRLLIEDEKFDDAVMLLRTAGDDPERHAVFDLHRSVGEALEKLDRLEEAEAAYRRELDVFPRNLLAYEAVARLYQTSGRGTEIEPLIGALVAEMPTPEGYAAASRVWAAAGDRTRADRLRADARARFRGDPSLTLLGTSARR